MKTRVTAMLIWAVSVAISPAADKIEASGKCPTCSTNLVSVPILIGLPTKEMAREVELGRALLGGCVGDPSKPEKALVCLKCRKWKTETMKYWQDLPKNFGKDSEESKKSETPNKSVEPTPSR